MSFARVAWIGAGLLAAVVVLQPGCRKQAPEEQGHGKVEDRYLIEELSRLRRELDPKEAGGLAMANEDELQRFRKALGEALSFLEDPGQKAEDATLEGLEDLRKGLLDGSIKPARPELDHVEILKLVVSLDEAIDWLRNPVRPLAVPTVRPGCTSDAECGDCYKCIAGKCTPTTCG